eukprot:scaffold1327_cov65-Cyclotella_meneghiniana.AAC.7
MMPGRTPLLLLTAAAIAVALTYLLKSHNGDDDDDEHYDLQLHDDGSDDITVQVKNGGPAAPAEERSTVASDDLTPDAGKVDEARGAVEVPVNSPADPIVITADEDATQTIVKSLSVRDDKSEKEQEESIRQEAMSKAASIIQSMPAVSVVDECIQEVYSSLSGEEEINATTDMSTIHEEEEQQQQTLISEPLEESNPIQLDSTPKKNTPKKSPLPINSPEKIIEAPTDTTDYSKLKNYWKQQDNRNTFSPPRKTDTELLPAATVTTSSPMKPPSETKETSSSSLIQSSSNEENAAASAAVAGLMAAGVVNMLDQVYSPKTSQTNLSFDGGKEDEGMPVMDVSIVREDEIDNSQDNATAKREDSDEQLILAGERSSSSGSDDKSTSDDYVKIVRTPSGDPISESALLSRPVEIVAHAKSDEENRLADDESKTSNVVEESNMSVAEEKEARIESVSESNIDSGGAGETLVENAATEEKPKQTKSRSKKKKKGKKK